MRCYQSINRWKASALLVIITVFFSCRQIEVFEKNTPIPNYEWRTDYAATGSFTITDTVSSYNIYVVLRHTDRYRFNNIWLNIGMKSPGDSMRYQKADLSLGSDAGGWAGNGLNDIWEVQKELAVNKRFMKPGEYQFSIFHVMRDNPLKYVMSAGLRVQKVP